MTQEAILDLVRRERRRQDKLCGEQNHPPSDWMTILGEEFGEACRAALDIMCGEKALENYRDELVQVAAVAIAALESFDRGKWRQK